MRRFASSPWVRLRVRVRVWAVSRSRDSHCRAYLTLWHDDECLHSGVPCLTGQGSSMVATRMRQDAESLWFEARIALLQLLKLQLYGIGSSSRLEGSAGAEGKGEAVSGSPS